MRERENAYNGNSRNCAGGVERRGGGKVGGRGINEGEFPLM